MTADIDTLDARMLRAFVAVNAGLIRMQGNYEPCDFIETAGDTAARFVRRERYGLVEVTVIDELGAW